MKDNNEQWKSGGDCSKCRRYKYCSKPCRESTRARDSFIYNAILEKTKMGKVLQTMNDIRCGRKEHNLNVE